jgi:hypothetical protein
MTQRDLRSFVLDVQRLRPVASVMLAVVVTLPSLWEVASGNLSAITLLLRLVLALAVCTALVWAATGLILRYARLHAQRAHEGERFGAIPTDLDG